MPFSFCSFTLEPPLSTASVAIAIPLLLPVLLARLPPSPFHLLPSPLIAPSRHAGEAQSEHCLVPARGSLPSIAMGHSDCHLLSCPCDSVPQTLG